MWLYVPTSNGTLYSKQITVQTGKSVFAAPFIIFENAVAGQRVPAAVPITERIALKCRYRYYMTYYILALVNWLERRYWY